MPQPTTTDTTSDLDTALTTLAQQLADCNPVRRRVLKRKIDELLDARHERQASP